MQNILLGKTSLISKHSIQDLMSTIKDYEAPLTGVVPPHSPSYYSDIIADISALWTDTQTVFGTVY